MKTTTARPVLFPCEESTIHLSHGKLIESTLPTGKSTLYKSIPQQLILISDEDIDEGDIAFFGSLLIEVARISIPNDTVTFINTLDNKFQTIVGIDRFKKVIATQSQLSPEYIQQAISEYNNGEMKDVDIEMEDWCDYDDDNTWLGGLDKPDWRPKLTNGFISIVEKEGKEYPRNMLLNMQYYMEYCQSNGYVRPDVWLEKFKHFPDDKEPIVYTKEEVETLCINSYLAAIETTGEGWNGEYANGNCPDIPNIFGKDAKEWFNNNKKK